MALPSIPTRGTAALDCETVRAWPRKLSGLCRPNSARSILPFQPFNQELNRSILKVSNLAGSQLVPLRHTLTVVPSP